MFELDPLGLHAEVGRESALEADRHVAEPDRPMLLVQKRLRDDPDRVGEVDDPCSPRAPATDELGQFEHHGHRAKSLGEATRAGRLLPDVAEPRRKRLIEEPRRLSADAQLDHHEIGAVDGSLAIESHGQATRPAAFCQDPARQAAHDLKALTVDVEQGKLVHRQPVLARDEALNQLGRVGATAAHHGDLQTHASLSLLTSGRRLGEDFAEKC